MIKHVIFSCIFICLQFVSSLNLPAQSEKFSRKQSCAYDGEPRKFDEAEMVWGFSSTAEAEEIVNRILAVVGSNMKKAKFTIKSADVPNAEAVVENGQRLILYSPDYMIRVKNIGSWADVSIMAHEIGHHVLGHTLSLEGSRPAEELDADEWSGFALCKMGATLDEAQSALRSLVKDGQPRPSSTHPPKSARINAIANGFALANCGVGGNPKMVYVEGNGSINSFYMGKYEITKGQFASFIAETNYQTDAEKGGSSNVWTGSTWEDKKGVTWRNNVSGTGSQPNDHPVIHVSWNDAKAYCAWLSKKTGENYGLPQEAQWEYAADGGKNKSGYEYAGSSKIDEVAWYDGNSGNNTHAVGGKKANALGIYDMSGNVWEWCEDLYSIGGSNRIGRGGRWDLGATDCRVAYRNFNSPDRRDGSLGFRLSRTL